MKKFLFFAVVLAIGFSGSIWAQNSSEYHWDDRLQDYLHRTYAWQRFATLVPSAGIQHLLNNPKQWDREPESFAYRYASAFGRRVAINSVELGLGALLKEDTRFEPSYADGFGGRIRHALFGAFLTSGDRRSFAFSRLGATAGGVMIPSTWDPRPMTGSRFASGMAAGYAGYVGNSLLVEFSDDIRRLTTKILGRSGKQPIEIPAP